MTALRFVGAAFAFRESAAPTARATPGPVAMYQLTLDRAFQVTVPLQNNSATFTMPPGLGIVITEMRPALQYGDALTFSKNGVGEVFSTSNANLSINGDDIPTPLRPLCESQIDAIGRQGLPRARTDEAPRFAEIPTVGVGERHA